MDSQPASASNPSLGMEFTQPSVSALPNLVPNDLDLTIAVRKGVRSCTQHPLANYLFDHRFSQNHKSFLTSLDTIIIPKLVDEALKDQNWKQVMLEEMRALNKNQTWELVPRPKGVTPVGCRWIFNLKYKADGTLEV